MEIGVGVGAVGSSPAHLPHTVLWQRRSAQLLALAQDPPRQCALPPASPPPPSFHRLPTPEWVNSWTWLGFGSSAITYQLPELLLSHLRALCPLRTRDSCQMHCTELMGRKMLLSTPWAPSWVAVFLSISLSLGNFSRWACRPDPRLLFLPPALSVNKLTVHPAWVC